MRVHGDIRRLEIPTLVAQVYPQVHGDIRRLEKQTKVDALTLQVHGDIRRLEIRSTHLITRSIRSWRHTPFRKP